MRLQNATNIMTFVPSVALSIFMATGILREVDMKTTTNGFIHSRYAMLERVSETLAAHSSTELHVAT